jgi:Flp pilus assembly protein TadB
VALILAGLLIYYGFVMNIPFMILAGGLFIMVGLFLQVLYLRTRYRRNGKQRSELIGPSLSTE